MKAFGSSCCNKLKDIVDKIYEDFISSSSGGSGGSGYGDPFEAVLALSVPGGIELEGLTTQEIETLCSATNARFIREGHSEIYISPGRISLRADAPSDLSRLGGPKESPTSSNKYCDMDIWGEDNFDMFETIADVVGDICFFGCFAAVLYQAALMKYDSIKDEFTVTTSALQSVLQQMLQAPAAWGQIGADFVGSVLDAINALIDSIKNMASTLPEFDNWVEMVWLFIKSYLVRYKDAIVFGIMQKQIDSLIEDLNSRSTNYSILEQKIGEVGGLIMGLAGYDWWDELKEAIEKAMVQINAADQSLQLAQAGAATGHWDDKHLSQGKASIMVAKNSISSVDMIYEMMQELKTSFNDPSSFKWNFGHEVKNKFLGDLDALGKAIDDCRDIMSCIRIQSTKIQATEKLFELTAKMIDIGSGSINLEASIDVTLGAGIITNSRVMLKRMYDEMNATIINEDRISAPVYISAWNAELRLILLGFDAVNIVAELPWLSPLSIGGYVNSVAAINQINTLLMPALKGHQKSLPERDLGQGPLNSAVEGFFGAIMNVGLLMGDSGQWETRVSGIRAGLRNAEAADKATADFCSIYSGHESMELDTVLGLLEDAGWGASGQMLLEGKLSAFLSMSLFSLSTGAMFGCLADLLSKDPPSAGAINLLEGELDEQRAISIASIRGPATLPAFQFKLMNSIAQQIRATGERINKIAELKDEVC